MDEEQQNNSEDGFFKRQASKAKDKAKDEAKKQGKKKIVSLIVAHPIGVLAVLGVILIVTVIVILLAGFHSIITYDSAKDASDAKKSAVAISIDGTTGITDTTKVIVSKTDNGTYEINNSFTDEELDEIKEDIKESTVNISEFTDFEIGIIGALLDNGVDIDDYEEDELKCLPAFLKAESCTQFLDLRPNSQKFDSNGNYKPRQMSELSENEIPGIILVQRTNTKETAPTPLEYKKLEDFNSLVTNNDINVKNYFTINEKGNLIIAKWDNTSVTVNGNFPQEIPEEEKVQAKNENIITTTEIPYSQYVSKYTMPFEFLTQLMIITEDPEFCKEVTDIVLGSKIVINIQEEETITTDVESRTYDVHSKEEKYIDYEVTPNIENQTNYFINLTKDDEQKDCTTYKNEKTTVTITTINTSHTYAFEIVEADTWIAHYKKTYQKQPVQTEPETTSNIDSKGEYEAGEEILITDNAEILNDAEAKRFKEDKEAYYKNKIPTPTVEVSNESKLGKNYKKIYVSPSGKFTTNLSAFEYEEQKVTNEDGTVTIKYNMPSSFTATTIKTDEVPAQVSFTFGLNSNYTYSLLSNTKDSIKCNISKLRILPYCKINLISEIKTNVTKYPSDPSPKTESHIYAKDDNGNFEKFLKAYDNNKDAREMINSIDSWLFEMMEENENTIYLLDIIKYLLYVYDGTNYGVTELDLENFFSNSIIMVGSYSSVGNISAFGCTLEREDFINYAKNYKTGNSTYQSKMANYAGDFYDVCTKYGVNPIIAYAHACLETQYGQVIPFNNYFGMAVYNGQASGTKYSSPKESIENYCNWVVNNATIGTTAYASNLNRAQKWSQYNEKLSGNPDTNIYVLYCRYAYLGDKHLCDEPDFSNPKGIEYYKSNGSTWGSGGRIYIYEMYENGGLYTGKYSEMCGHKNADDPTTDQEKADYAVYTTETRVNIAKNIFGEQALSSYGNGEIGQQIINAAERIRQHCTENNYSYNTAVPSYTEGVQALWNKRGVCCASYVAWVLSEVGYEDVVNDCYFRSSTELGKKLKTIFSEVGSYEEMQPGDIIVWPGHHTQIYAGDGYWYNGGASNPTVKYSKYDAREVFKNYGYYYILRPQ